MDKYEKILQLRKKIKWHKSPLMIEPARGDTGRTCYHVFVGDKKVWTLRDTVTLSQIVDAFHVGLLCGRKENE